MGGVRKRFRRSPGIPRGGSTMVSRQLDCNPHLGEFRRSLKCAGLAEWIPFPAIRRIPAGCAGFSHSCSGRRGGKMDRDGVDFTQQIGSRRARSPNKTKDSGENPRPRGRKQRFHSCSLLPRPCLSPRASRAERLLQRLPKTESNAGNPGRFGEQSPINQWHARSNSLFEILSLNLILFKFYENMTSSRCIGRIGGGGSARRRVSPSIPGVGLRTPSLRPGGRGRAQRAPDTRTADLRDRGRHPASTP